MEATTNTISVLGGGPSAQGLDLSRLPGLVIGVNDACVLAPVNVCVSMDRLWTENRWGQLMALAKPTHLRRGCQRNCTGQWPGLVNFECDHTSTVMSDAPGTLNGVNSGMCALNLAYQRRPARLLLFGFDMRRQGDRPYWWKPYEWRPKGATSGGKYAQWARQFDQLAPQFKAAGIEVINGCKNSAITAFPRVSPQTLLG